MSTQAVLRELCVAICWPPLCSLRNMHSNLYREALLEVSFCGQWFDLFLHILDSFTKEVSFIANYLKYCVFCGLAIHIDKRRGGGWQGGTVIIIKHELTHALKEQCHSLSQDPTPLTSGSRVYGELLSFIVNKNLMVLQYDNGSYWAAGI